MVCHAPFLSVGCMCATLQRAKAMPEEAACNFCYEKTDRERTVTATVRGRGFRIRTRSGVTPATS